jgi:hypothetical protein
MEMVNSPHDKSIWLRNIRNFMIEKGIQIKKTVQAYPLLREKDEYLMQKAAQLQLETKEIRFINYCRLYLNVITISDITEPDGIHICPEIYHLDKAVTWRQRSDTRYNQQLPEKHQWYAWRKLIKNLTLFGRRRLKQVLGDWTVTVDKIRIKYQAYRTENQVYERKDNYFIMSNITERNTLADTKSTVNTLPDNATPCKIMFRNTIGTKFQRKHKETRVREPQSTITEVILVADGSLLEGKGTWAAIMTDKRGVELASQQGQVTHNNLSSYRVELEGCLGALKLTKTIPGIQSCTL